MNQGPKKKLPVGIENFEEFFREDFYFVDKTMFIAELLCNWGKVNLFTRPRRFGKSLNMSMLKNFFEIGRDRKLFEGLGISQEKELCEKYMGKFPVISITLKDVDRRSFREALSALRNVIASEASGFSFLLESGNLTEDEKSIYRAITKMEGGSYIMDSEQLVTSLKKLSELLSKHYGSQVILLIDEYDVPLDKAFQYGYYEEMVNLIRSMLGNALKTNEYLYFAVLTGCLRISKESIFTGLNNLEVHTITDSRYAGYFGFTETDVADMLEFYGLEDHGAAIREWYDGYRFGKTEVYCPWDVINYCKALLDDPDAEPENYWANTSGNALVRRFIGKADRRTRSEIERLIAGESIVKTVNQELTYSELDSSIENLWSVLFATGYLTLKERSTGRQFSLVIPNREIRELFISQIQEWFQAESRADVGKLREFCSAFQQGDAVLAEELLNEYLWKSISIRDTAVRMDRKENFYHGMLLGLLQYESEWDIASNAESGEGYSDILIRTENRTGIVMEIKYADDGNLEQSCENALDQIEEKKYDAVLKKERMKEILKYGIAFYKKNCRVVLDSKE